jgi:hypothetical protein
VTIFRSFIELLKYVSTWLFVSLWFVRFVSGGLVPVNSFAVAGFPHLERG